MIKYYKVPSFPQFMVDEKGNIYNSETRNKLKSHELPSGYCQIKTTLKGISYSNYCHRLVCEAFHDKPEGKDFVNHKDGNKSNNHPSNLEWMTRSENQLHATRVLNKKVKSYQIWSCKLSESDVHEICKLMEEGYTNLDLSFKFNVDGRTLSCIRSGHSWKHITKKYNLTVTRKNRISEKTVHWICQKLKEGMDTKEILNISKSASITHNIIQHIKKKRCHKDISDHYF